jgi:short-subunit dehydrogenase
LVASAGIHRFTHGCKFDPQVTRDANEVIATNVSGVINAFAAVLPGMVERQSGHLCAIASIAGLLGLPTASVYSAAKAAVLTLCDGLRVDLRSAGVQVTAAGPGFVDTPMIRPEGRPAPDRVRVMSASTAARRIAWAIEHGRATYFFPTRTWIQAWIASKLPPAWFAWLWAWMIRRKEALKSRGE